MAKRKLVLGVADVSGGTTFSRKVLVVCVPAKSVTAALKRIAPETKALLAKFATLSVPPSSPIKPFPNGTTVGSGTGTWPLPTVKSKFARVANVYGT